MIGVAPRMDEVDIELGFYYVSQRNQATLKGMPSSILLQLAPNTLVIAPTPVTGTRHLWKMGSK